MYVLFLRSSFLFLLLEKLRASYKVRMSVRRRCLKMNYFVLLMIFQSIIITIDSRSLDAVNFPDLPLEYMDEEEKKKVVEMKESLPPPEPCEFGLTFCGEDESKYIPKEFIESVISSNTKVQQWIDETSYHQSDIPFIDDEEPYNILPACQSRREKLPNFGRSRNIKNKWKYIIQIAQIVNSSSYTEVLICEKPGMTCINDSDSPDGEGSTVCRQAYRRQRLLAMDENGEPSVDSFPLPSGCICHHLQNDPNLRRAYIQAHNKTNTKEEELENDENSDLLEINVRLSKVNTPIDLICNPVEESSISLTNGRIRRSSDIIIFPAESDTSIVVTPPPKINDDLAERSNENLVEQFEKKKIPMMRKVEPCPNGDSFCQLLASYPKNFIDAVVNRSNHFNNLEPFEFNQYHSTVCQDPLADYVVQRTGTFENNEIPLCVSETEIIHPQKGRNVHGEWRHIVNTDIYKQGVSLNRCVKNFEGKSCLYDGNMGIFPDATICKQQYSTHPFVIISPSGEKKVELFKIPTACVCHIQDESIF